MRDWSIPTPSPLVEWGAQDPVFDGFVLLGPLVLLVVALLGRTPLTQVLAAGYVASFLGYVAYRGLRS